MAFMTETIVMVAISTLVIMVENCDANSMCNVTAKTEPQGKVELIELMLPRHIINGDVNANDDTKRSVSEEEPRFEISIQPDQNVRSTRAAPKIKIFDEHGEHISRRQSPRAASGTSSTVHGDLAQHKPLPLAIKNTHLNADRRTEKDRPEQHGKGQEHSVKFNSDNTSLSHEVGRKESGELIKKQGVQIDGNPGSRTNKNTPSYGTQRKKDKTNDTVPSTEPFQVNTFHRRTVPESTTRRVEPEQIKTAVQEPVLYQKERTTDKEHNLRKIFESLPPPYHEEVTTPAVRKELVYDPNIGILVTQSNYYDSKLYSQNSASSTGVAPGYLVRDETPTEDISYEETRSEINLRLPKGDADVVPVDLSFAGDADENRGYANSGSKNRYTQRKPPYVAQQRPVTPTPTNGYPELITSYRAEHTPRSDGRYSTEEKRVYNSYRGDYSYDRPENARVITNTERPYQAPPRREYQDRYETTTNPPANENSYSGFPESHTGNAYESSRPTADDVLKALPVSPCPSVFKYTKHESDRWYADIYVTTDVVLTGLRLDVVLNGRADMLAADTPLVKSTNNIIFTILSLKKKLVPNSPEVVHIIVKYNADDGRKAPILKILNLNGRMICPSIQNSSPKVVTKAPYVFPGEVYDQKRTTERIPYTRPADLNVYTTTTSKPRTKLTPSTEYILPPNSDLYDSPDYGSQNRLTTERPNQSLPATSSSRPGLNNDGKRKQSGSAGNGNSVNQNGSGRFPIINNNSKRIENRNVPCGLPAVQPRPLITGGQKTARGQWPWHAALYKNMGPNLSYSCGGSLVTDLHVITAAHCVTEDSHSTSPMNPNILVLYFGKYLRYVWTENNIATREVVRVDIHPDFNNKNFRADIAVLTLASPVLFTDYIKPVCLWDRRITRLEDIVGLHGTVVGWGFDWSNHLSDELKQAKMPIVNQNECLWSYPEFYPKFTSNMTFCAGFRNGTSVCNGDSGGGMVFPIKVNREERWFLRGLVSLSPELRDTRICDPSQFIVFTDVAKYLPWLETLIS